MTEVGLGGLSELDEESSVMISENVIRGREGKSEENSEEQEGRRGGEMMGLGGLSER